MLVRFNQARMRAFDDRGASLVPVLIVFAVGFVVAVMVASIALFSVRTVAQGRSSVASLAAAEAGRDSFVATLSKQTPGCTTPTIAQTTAPAFTATVYTSSAATAPTTADGLVAGCPNAATTFVVIKSIGSAPDGSSTRTDTVYAWAVTDAVSVGAGAFGYMDNGFKASLGSYTGDMVLRNGDFTCSTATTINGDVYVLNGDFSCTFAVTVNGGIYVANGDVKLASTSKVTKSIYASGNVSLVGGITVGSAAAPSGIVAGGDVLLDSTLIPYTTVNGPIDARGSLNAKSSIGGVTQINGNVRIGGSLKMSTALSFGGKINGDATVAGKSGSVIDLWTGVTGTLRIAGTPDFPWCIGAPCGRVGTYLPNTAGLTAPAISSPIPVNLYDRTAWMDLNAQTPWSGYTDKLTFTGSQCTRGNFFVIPGVFTSYATKTIVDALERDGAPLLIDTTKCTSKLDFTFKTINAKRSAVLLVKNASFLFGMVNASGSPAPTTTSPRQLFVVQVDDNVNRQPDCAAGFDKLGYGLSSDGVGLFTSNAMRVMLYSPCGIAYSGSASTLKGQLYTKRDVADNSILQNYECRPMWIENTFDLACDIDDPGRWGVNSVTATKKLGVRVSQTER